MTSYAVVIPHFPANACFREIAETVHYGLLALGHDSVLSATTEHEKRRVIAFGWQLLDPAAKLAADTILYSLEQVGTPQTEAFSLLKKHSVWDYADHNVALWRQRGVNATHVPIGYVAELTRIRIDPEPRIDVVFYGALSERRTRTIRMLERAGLKVCAFEGLYGAARDDIIAQSKVVLNLSFHDRHRVFEIVRVSYALANATCVVSEGGHGDAPFREAAVIVDYDELVGACVAMVRDDARRAAQAKRGFEIMRSMPETEVLRRVLS
jgi:hypothetical protein